MPKKKSAMVSHFVVQKKDAPFLNKKSSTSPQKLSSLKNHSKYNSTPPPLKQWNVPWPSEMASSSNCRWQSRKERPNRSTNNEDTANKAKRPVIEF